MYIVISQYLTWQKETIPTTIGVLKMHKHLEPADLQIHEHEIPLRRSKRSMAALRKARNSFRAIYE